MLSEPLSKPDRHMHVVHVCSVAWNAVSSVDHSPETQESQFPTLNQSETFNFAKSPVMEVLEVVLRRYKQCTNS